MSTYVQQVASAHADNYEEAPSQATEVGLAVMTSPLRLMRHRTNTTWT